MKLGALVVPVLCVVAAVDVASAAQRDGGSSGQLSAAALGGNRVFHSYTLDPPKSRSWKEFGETSLQDPRGELQEFIGIIGPYGVLAACPVGTDTQRCPSGDWQATLARPAPTERIEVAFWGDWTLIHATNDSEIPRSQLYLHHILAYTGGTFITGCSSERTTWGVDHLPYPYRQVLEPNQQVAAGGFHYNNLGRVPLSFRVRYRILYKVHVPTHPKIRVVESFYWMDNYNVAAVGPNTTNERSQDVRVPRQGVVVSMNGHLHQGGIKLVVREKESGEVVCESRNIYSEIVPCVWDCPDVCFCDTPPCGWTAQYGTTTCYMERPMLPDTELVSTSYYDSSCAWRGVMA